ncbi:TlpA family protein disulfide reductase [Chryseobacterium sp. WG14]|uniref:TlpA family protein disulfide reductase n=1 Tax=unclassified Chryseobacterium TaxID=2593645 RepID=UPI001D6CAB5A|nr:MULTISPECIES: TlpA disulfide reductase family protein [unclassified Chryseobacterium]MCQ9637272.1 TlpA family protein disulfide reductase [Chryseobacterium sp. WG23]MCQ9639458.1 TlpA family protein disulfide reductase [Chryseobacterium sp. WG14]CAH0209079.1 Thiol-disulfide oxidoreductase ResA [Chryseobacterium sp. Bi04]
MKKIILSTLIITALFSCKKESQKTENTATDSLSVTKNTAAETTAYVPKELSPENVGQHLAKNNDTLYVTNFFATWCGPCMKEIPSFKNKMEELKGKPVKFTFVNLDEKSDWDGAVKNFVVENNLSGSVILLDGQKLDPTFFSGNFKQWDGGSIPFTFMRKGDKTDEYLGMMTEDVLNSKIDSFLK